MINSLLKAFSMLARLTAMVAGVFVGIPSGWMVLTDQITPEEFIGIVGITALYIVMCMLISELLGMGCCDDHQ